MAARAFLQRWTRTAVLDRPAVDVQTQRRLDVNPRELAADIESMLVRAVRAIGSHGGVFHLVFIALHDSRRRRTHRLFRQWPDVID